MKKISRFMGKSWKKFLVISAIVALFIFNIPLTLATEPPEVDPVTSPVNATKQVIKGTSEPGAKITVTGGPYEIAPVYADDEGYFEITVALVQESTNTFYIKATGADGVASESVTVVIVESDEQTAAQETATGKDLTAPAAPEVSGIETPTDADSYLIIGTGEANATLEVSGDYETEVEIDEDGNFEVEVPLEQNTKNTFYLMVVDAAGNPGSSIKIEILEQSEGGEGEGETVYVYLPTDIQGHWAEEYITELYTEDTVSGYEDGTFGPDDSATRAQLTKIALNAFEYDVPESVSETSFSDVSRFDWFAPYVETAKDEEIASGYSDGTFKPDNYINRAEALKILFEASGVEDIMGSDVFLDSSFENIFSDVSSSSWYADYVMMAYHSEIVSGYSSDTFKPGNNITRAEICKITVELRNLRAEILSTPTI